MMLMMTTGGFQTPDSMTKHRGRQTTQVVIVGRIDTTSLDIKMYLVAAGRSKPAGAP